MTVAFEILQSTVFKNRKTSAQEKGDGNKRRNQQNEDQKEITIFCSTNCKFSVFFCCLMQF